MKKILILTIIFELAGCVTAYKEPSGEDKTSVQFRGNRPFSVFVYDDKNCTQNEQRAVGLPTPPYIMTKPLSPEESKEVFLKTNQPMFTLFRGLRMLGNKIQVCGVPLNYQFQKGIKYDAFYDWNEGHCEVHLSEVSGNISAPLHELTVFSSQLQEENIGCFVATAKRRE